MPDDLFTAAATTDEDDVPRDQWGRYLLPDPFGKAKGRKAYTRATTFAKSCSDTYTLSMWGERMVAHGLALRPDLYALACSTPLTDRDALNKLSEQAKEAAGAKSRAALGTALHTFTEQHDRGEQVTAPAVLMPEVQAYSTLVDQLGIEMVEIERIVVVPELGVAGTFDRIGRITTPITTPMGHLRRGQCVIVDLKTGRDLSYGWGEIAVQLALYSHGAGMWRQGTDHYDPMPPVRWDIGLVIHLPVRDDPAAEAKATLHAVDLTQGWKAAQLCRDVRAWRKQRELASEVVVSEVAKDRASLRLPTYEERIAAASSVTELSAIWRDARSRGLWTSKLADLGRDQASKLRTV